MAGLKVAFLLLVCSALVMSFNIDNRIKRQATETSTTASDSTTTTSSDNDATATTSSDNDVDTTTTGSGSNDVTDTTSSDNDATNTSSDSTQSSAASNAASKVSNGIKNVGKRLQNAFNQTYQEEKNSVSDSWNNVKKLIHQDIETKTNLTKTAFDLGTIIPKFGKNLIISN